MSTPTPQHISGLAGLGIEVADIARLVHATPEEIRTHYADELAAGAAHGRAGGPGCLAPAPLWPCRALA